MTPTDRCASCGSTTHHEIDCPTATFGYPEPEDCETCGAADGVCSCYANAMNAAKEERQQRAEDENERRIRDAWAQREADADVTRY